MDPRLKPEEDGGWVELCGKDSDGGRPYFAGPRPPLRLMAHDRIGEDVIRLIYVPA
ncbi:hypothetical protein AB9F41_19105 [Rhizobium leguminosarum]|nr:hypothetical protein [Rhizobium leguminosarum]